MKEKSGNLSGMETRPPFPELVINLRKNELEKLVKLWLKEKIGVQGADDLRLLYIEISDYTLNNEGIDFRLSLTFKPSTLS